VPAVVTAGIHVPACPIVAAVVADGVGAVVTASAAVDGDRPTNALARAAAGAGLIVSVTAGDVEPL
jgi:hypothetical protein